MPKAKQNRKFIYDLVLVSISASLITVCSWIAVPAGPVPFTLQTMAILAVMLAAGGKRGTMAVLIYLLMGACGVPVFAGLKGGISSFTEPAGGFLIGFLIAACLYWLLDSMVFRRLMKGKVRTWIFAAVNALIFELVVYTTGVIWFMSVYVSRTGPVGLATVLGWCVFPFVIPDMIKLIASVFIGERARKLVKF